jgi:hypothetical protein
MKIAKLKLAIIALLVLVISLLPAAASEIYQFGWIGQDADMVGTWDNGKPDGGLDGHFRIGLDLPDPVEITSILLYTFDENGNPEGGQFWDTANTRYYILGVFDQGTQLYHTHVQSLGTFSGDVQFDLYAADSSWFIDGYSFTVAVTLADGTELKRVTTIGESIDWPVETPGKSPSVETSGTSAIPSEDEQAGSGRSKIESILQGDSGSTESGSTESGSTESGSTESGSYKSGSYESGSTESGSSESGSYKSGSYDSGSTESGSSESGSEDQSSAPTGTAAVILDSWNTEAVDNSPNCSPTLTLSEPHMITYIDTYHWNYGQGTKSGGSISLKDGNGETFGPWQVEAQSASGVANAWWIARPNEIIPAGNYIIIDSQPETWSLNAKSPCGFVKIEGYPVQANPEPVDETEGQSESKGTVRANIAVDGECSNPIDMLISGCDKGLPGIPVELTFTYIPPAYYDVTPNNLRETTDENGIAYFQDVPAGSKFILKTAVKGMEKEQEGSMLDPAEDVYITFDYRCKGSYPEEERKRLEQIAGVGPDGRITGIVTPVCGNEGVICSPECDLYPL